ncbi:MAG: 3-keto-5-aminohexanoate cleavage protein [Dictyoglomaceae bacterium]|nr:3-keto-5-aminohexanoate cleavage protein [Dictyoglomaceae bacterium]
MEKIIIGVAPVGGWGEGKNNPLTPKEIAEEVYRCWNEGASYVHLHVRDEKGILTDDLTLFKETVNLIKAKCDIIIDGSTGGYPSLTPHQRSLVLEVPEVELASLNMGSCNFFDGVYINSPKDIEFWANKMREKRIKPIFEVFEVGMIENAKKIINKNLFLPPYLFDFCLNFPGAMPISPKNILFLSESLPENSIWGLVYYGGKNSILMQVTAISLSATMVRCGFEDSPYIAGEELAKSNAQLVEKIVKIIREIGKDIASPYEARRILGLS